MADIFSKQDAIDLLIGKTVRFLGDSNTLALYKDLIWLLETGDLPSIEKLKQKQPKSIYQGEELTYGSELTASRCYQEEREYIGKGIRINFNFITRVYNEYVDNILECLKDFDSPDIFIINSCLWDLSRWGPNGIDEYKENILKLLNKCKDCLSPNCLFIWCSALPMSQTVRRTFLVPQLQFLPHTLRFNILEANAYVQNLIQLYKYDFLDLHYHLRMQIHRRSDDGVHWAPLSVRHMTNLLLAHISLSWKRNLPGTYPSVLLKNAQKTIKDVTDNTDTTRVILTAKRRLRKVKPENNDSIFRQNNSLKAVETSVDPMEGSSNKANRIGTE